MIAASTRRFMAMVAIAQHFGRPATPTDQAWTESRGGTIKAEWPHLLAITNPATLRAELDLVRAEYNSQRLLSGSGYVTPLDEHEGRAGLNYHHNTCDRGHHDGRVGGDPSGFEGPATLTTLSEVNR